MFYTNFFVNRVGLSCCYVQLPKYFLAGAQFFFPGSQTVRQVHHLLLSDAQNIGRSIIFVQKLSPGPQARILLES